MEIYVSSLKEISLKNGEKKNEEEKNFKFKSSLKCKQKYV